MKMFRSEVGVYFPYVCRLADVPAMNPLSEVAVVKEAVKDSAMSSGVAIDRRKATELIVQLRPNPPVASNSAARNSICTRPNLYCEPNGDVEDCAPPL